MANVYDEIQGIDMVHIAEVTEDTADAYATEQFEQLAPAGELTKTTEQASSTTYYDNVPFNAITSEGADTLTLTCPVLPIAVYGKILGKTVDPTTGALFDEGIPSNKYFAVSYRLRFVDGTFRYVVKYKVKFSIPDEAAKTLDASTDVNNMSLTMTAINTTHKFEANGKSMKGIFVDERDGKADVSTWFDTVVTPDNIKAKTV